MNEQKKITFDSFIRGVIGVAIFIAVLYMLNRLSGVLLPFFIAWIIAYLMYPMVKFYQNRLKIRNRALAIFAVMVSLIVLVTGAIFLIVPPMIDECVKLKSLIEVYFSEGGKFTSIPKDITDFLHNNVDWAWMKENLNSENIIGAVKSVLPKMWSLLSTSYNIVLTIFTLFIIVLYLFFILLDYEEIADGWVTLLPAKYRNMVLGIINDIKDSMNKGQYEQVFPWSGFGCVLCRDIVQYRFFDNRFSFGDRSWPLHWAFEYGAVFANHRLCSYYHIGFA